MELATETVIALVVGTAVFAILVRWWFLTARSLWWGEEAIGDLQALESEQDD